MKQSVLYWNHLFQALIMNSNNSSKFVVLFCLFKVFLKLKPSIHKFIYQINMNSYLLNLLTYRRRRTPINILIVNSESNVNKLTCFHISLLLPLSICLCLTFGIHEHLFKINLKVPDTAKQPNISEMVIHWHSDIFRIS